MTQTSSIDYEVLLQAALKQMMGNVLNLVATQGLPGDHHFYIGFNTQHMSVEISDRLKKDYPEEMVIVLRHQFENLLIETEHFSVDLFFGGIRESLKIPFEAVTRFEDPSANFALQFSNGSVEDILSDEDLNSLEDELGEELDLDALGQVSKFPKASGSGDKADKSAATETASEDENKVVSLDHFRKP